MNGTAKEIFKVRVSELRKEKSLSRTDIAEMLSLSSQSAVANWESGLSTPDYDKLCLLSDIFDCSIDYLLGRVDTKHLNSGNSDNYWIYKIEACDEIGQGTIKACIDYQFERCTSIINESEKKKNNDNYIERLFLKHDDPEYEVMMAKKPYLVGLKKSSKKSYMDITTFLWSAGYGDEICLAYVMEIFNTKKDTRVPSKKLFSDIEAFLKNDYSILIHDKK